MNNEVNLIASRKKSSAEKEAFIKTIHIVAYVSLGVVIACAIILFIINQDTTFTDLSKREKITLTGLSIANSKVAKFLVTKQRLQEVATILNQRSNYDRIISNFSSGVPAGLSVDSFSLNKQAISVTVSSFSLEDVNTFLSFMVDTLNTKKTYSSLSINGVSADAKTGKYTLVMEAKFL